MMLRRFLMTATALLVFQTSPAQRTRLVIDWKTTALVNSLQDTWQTTRFMKLKGTWEMNPLVAPVFNLRSPALFGVMAGSLQVSGLHSINRARCVSWLLPLMSLIEMWFVGHNQAHFGASYGYPVLTLRF